MAIGLASKADYDVHYGRRGYPRKSSYHRYLKRAKARAERRRAKKDPECVPGYGKYRGWET